MKITLRPIQLEDLELLYAMHTEVDKRLLSPLEPYNIQHMRDRVSNTWVIQRDGEPVGTLGFDHYEVGFWVAEPHRNQGIATKAVEIALRNCTLSDVDAGCWSDNAASRKVLERNGFQFDRTKMIDINGEPRESSWFYKVLKDEQAA